MVSDMAVKTWSSGPLRGRGHDTHPPVCRMCQDYCSAETFMNYAIAAVSDGHGGNRYYRSSVGSKLAVEIAISAVEKHLSDDEFVLNLRNSPDEMLIGTLVNEIVSEWRDAVDRYDRENPATEGEIEHRKQYDIPDGYSRKTYGATLLLAVLSEEFSFGIQIGDGDLVTVYQNATTCTPVPMDERCVDNKTTSLSDKDAENEFRYFCTFSEIPSALTISSDGVSTYWETYDRNTSMKKFMDYSKNASVYCAKGIEHLLLENLRKRTAMGHEDDISMCVLYIPEKMTKVVSKVDEEYSGYFGQMKKNEEKKRRDRQYKIICYRSSGPSKKRRKCRK